MKQFFKNRMKSVSVVLRWEPLAPKGVIPFQLRKSEREEGQSSLFELSDAYSLQLVVSPPIYLQDMNIVTLIRSTQVFLTSVRVLVASTFFILFLVHPFGASLILSYIISFISGKLPS